MWSLMVSFLEIDIRPKDSWIPSLMFQYLVLKWLIKLIDVVCWCLGDSATWWMTINLFNQKVSVAAKSDASMRDFCTYNLASWEKVRKVEVSTFNKQNRDRLIDREQVDGCGGLEGGGIEQKWKKDSWTWTTVWWLLGEGYKGDKW